MAIFLFKQTDGRNERINNTSVMQGIRGFVVAVFVSRSPQLILYTSADSITPAANIWQLSQLLMAVFFFAPPPKHGPTETDCPGVTHNENANLSWAIRADA